MMGADMKDAQNRLTVIIKGGGPAGAKKRPDKKQKREGLEACGEQAAGPSFLRI